MSIYVYPLPTEMSLEHVYQRDMKRRGQYYANLEFMQQARETPPVSPSDPSSIWSLAVQRVCQAPCATLRLNHGTQQQTPDSQL